jgi:hypothetical protein
MMRAPLLRHLVSGGDAGSFFTVVLGVDADPDERDADLDADPDEVGMPSAVASTRSRIGATRKAPPAAASP